MHKENFSLPLLNNRGNFHIHKVCITVSNSPKSPSCLDEAMETREKVLYCFYKIFLKDNLTSEGKC